MAMCCGGGDLEKDPAAAEAYAIYLPLH